MVSVEEESVRTRSLPAVGFLFAIASAASFALSGVFASALISAGWTAGAAATARVTVATLILAWPTLVMLRGKWRLVRRAWAHLLLFGLLAIAGCQLAYFLAIAYIPPSLALLIEFTGPVMLVFWFWARTRIAPSALTLVGAGTAVLGLLAITGVGTGAIHPLGLLFALIAAVGNAAYYAAGAVSDHGIDTLPFVGLGLGVASVTLIVASATGLLPFTMTANPAVIAGVAFHPVIAVLGVALISTVLAYLFGVGAARRLGATMASFTGYAEPLFGIIWTIVLLSVLPTGWQWVGAALILIGVVTVKLGEIVTRRRRETAARTAEPTA